MTDEIIASLHRQIALLEDRLRATTAENELLREDVLLLRSHGGGNRGSGSPTPCEGCLVMATKVGALEGLLTGAVVVALSAQIEIKEKEVRVARADAESSRKVARALATVATDAELEMKTVELGWGVRWAERRKYYHY